MRLGLITFALLSSTAFACPQLTGKYTACRSTTGTTGGSRDVIVTQTIIEGGYTQFNVTSTDDESQERSTDSVIADGQTRHESQTDIQTGITFDISTRATCVGNALQLQVTTLMQGSPMAELKSVITKSGNQMITQTTGDMMGENVNETVICE